MSAGAEVVVVEGVRRSFGALVPVLQDVSFRLEPGELVLLRGPSGAGKSTVLNLVAGLDRPDGGEVLVDGVRVAGLGHPARFRREVVGFVFQLHHLLAELTAEENVEVPLIPAHLRRSQRRARARAALAEVGLGDRATHRPVELSGGERQLTAVARAIVGRPRLLLADEPTGSLDAIAGERVLGLIGRLSRDQGMTVLLVSHDPRAAGRVDRVLELRDGRIVAPEPR
ncbi:ABC transporter ATP-binding protein [Baekduia soli]|uniref:ABC transporter ATP-binding protein n=1 Tax=Baekduia soli TaxID=496014 RepID=A0A5B8U6N2_9ACTN|nr:ABC transporter ATP-binding protein [Baekduia soli]QEC48744.1 ABC transporter ATP-binding protein [Baekduia soli]